MKNRTNQHNGGHPRDPPSIPTFLHFPDALKPSEGSWPPQGQLAAEEAQPDEDNMNFTLSPPFSARHCHYFPKHQVPGDRAWALESIRPRSTSGSTPY